MKTAKWIRRKRETNLVKMGVLKKERRHESKKKLNQIEQKQKEMK